MKDTVKIFDRPVHAGENGNPYEAVNHPDHYGGEDNPYECIKVLEAWLTRDEYIGFLKGNILKYTQRANAKGGAQDIAKAAWYSDRLAKFVKA